MSSPKKPKTDTTLVNNIAESASKNQEINEPTEPTNEPTEPTNNIDAIDKVYAGYNQEEINNISTYISRDKKLYSGEYLKDENFKNAEPAAYEKIKNSHGSYSKVF